MDPNRFDALSRALTTPGSRRTTLRTLLGTLLGTVLLGPSAENLAASPEKKAKDHDRKGNGRGGATKDRHAGKERSKPQQDGQQGRQPNAADRSTGEPAQDAAQAEGEALGGDEVTATSHGCGHAGAACARPGQCCTGKCLSSGKCSCNARNPCPQPANPCKKAVCSSTGRCLIKNRPAGSRCTSDNNPCTKDVCNATGQCTHPADATKNGTACGGGKLCQNGWCVPPPSCEPTCATSKPCGPDGCGGSCGSCGGNDECQNGTCVC